MNNFSSKFNSLLLNLIHKQVLENPNNVCIYEKNREIVYADFWLKCIGFANFLIQKSDKKFPIVCIYESKSIFDFVSIIGTLIAGGFYVPISQLTPYDKLIRIIKITNSNFFSIKTIEDSLKKIISTNIITDNKIHSSEKLNSAMYKQTNIAYILFTSGTTGIPKGVVISKKNLNSYIDWLVKKIKLNEKINCSQFTSIGFDLSVADFYLSLCSGSRLFIPDKFDMLYPARMIYKKRIHHLVCTPSFIDFIKNSKELTKKHFRDVKTIFFCGEPLYRKQVHNILKANSKINIINAYGPTEATVSMTHSLINKNNYKKLSKNTVTIGNPIPKMKIILVDSNLSKNKYKGEVLISGPQLSLGYFKLNRENKKKFINLYGRRYFRTGDYAYVNNGRYYFENRLDNQVKIKGYRVELNEINYYLREFGCTNVFTTVADARIVSFVQKNKLSILSLSKFLKKNLENYKIPSLIIPIKNFPLNKNKKIDIIALLNILKNKQNG
jgi:D-alanine--poly(phosphoribitol) ligase subunit 1